MRKVIIWACGIAAALALTATALPAGAAVVPAHGGITNASIGCNTHDSGFCGSQEFRSPHGQVLNVYHGGQGAKGQKITEWAHSDSADTDFYSVNYDGLSGSGGADKTFEYAPDGNRSGWCISFPSVADGSGAVLRHCNEGVWQTFRPLYVNGTFVAWKNLASGYVISDPGYASNGAAQLTQGVWTGSENQQVRFVS